jgi:DNA polymerase-3 subunit alpha
MYIVFDTETTGLPENFSAPITDFDNWPRIVQLAWKVYDINGKEISSHDRIIKPEGFIIPQESIRVHRITNERANKYGIPLKDALEEFGESVKNSKFLIAHNINFDDKITSCELLRLGMSNYLRDITQVCTMNSTVEFCRIQGKMGLKPPTLTELHEKLFNKPFEDAHNALVDVSALGKCFFKLKQIGALGFNENEILMLNSEKQRDLILNKWINKNGEPEESKKLTNFGIHTFYSVLEGAGDVSDYVKIAKKNNHDSLGLMDRGNLSGAFAFYQKCKSEGIKPIIGCEFFINDSIGVYEEKLQDNNCIQKVIVQNENGYQNINKINYFSFVDGYYRVPRIKTDWLIENKEGLILTTSSREGIISKFLQQGKYDLAEEYLFKMLNIFGRKSYLAEITLEDNPIQRQYNDFIIIMAEKYSMGIIFNHDVYYPNIDGSEMQDVLQSINQKRSIKKSRTKENRNMMYVNYDDVLKMNKDFQYNYSEDFLKMSIITGNRVAEFCDFEFEIDVEKYPQYEATDDVIKYFGTNDSYEIIKKLSHAKLKQKLNIYKKNGPVIIDEDLIKKYEERLDYELEVINDKKMIDYFLVVWELIRYCADNNIEVGPGRGSAAGCLLSWCLDITKIDPIRFGLYFERFLNPARKGPPDIDIDFETGSDVKTDEFLYNKYGKERVFPVITFSTFNEKGCIKDVVKAFDGDAGFESDIFAVTKEMPKTFMKYEGDLKDWLKEWPNNPECSYRVKNWITDEKNKKILDITLDLQGQVRNLGKHAAGIVITPGPVWESMPINIVKGVPVSGFQESGSGKDLSTLGILKLDRLNLTTLNVIKETINLIKYRKGIDVSEQVKYVDLDNKDLFEELRGGNNQGVFQFESDGMSRLIKDMHTETFEEMVAANSLYRPGPMGVGAHEEYIRNKKDPASMTPVHESLVPLLKDTNGVLIFQEQLMFIAHELGGMTLGDGDNLRKVMDKASKIIKKNLTGDRLEEKEKNDKSYKEYVKLWEQFKVGCKDKGLSESEIQKIEEWLIKYLGYSFNRSHAVSYSYVAMQTLFLKRYYPTEFYTALLNHAKDDDDWLSSAIMGAFSKGIKILPPKRQSKWSWTMLDDDTILMGFSSINGMGEVAYLELQDMDISNVEKDKFFMHKFSKFNKANFEACLKSGMFDDWSDSRDELLEYRKVKMKQNVMQLDLFGQNSFDIVQQNFKGKFEPTPHEKKYKEFIEVCVLDLELFNKISTIKKEFQTQYGINIEAVTSFEEPDRYYYFVLKKLEAKKSKNNKNYWSLELSDGGSSVKMIIWEDIYDRLKDTLEIGGIYLTKFSKDRNWLRFQDGAQFRRIY